MFHKKAQPGETVVVQGLTCHLPAKGWLFDDSVPGKKGEWVKEKISYRSTNPRACYWERDPRFLKLDEWYEIQDERQITEPGYQHPQLAKFITDCWRWRTAGFWFSNDGEATYITGYHWYYLTCYDRDTGFMDYRETDREVFYFWQYCVEDPKCFGILESVKRRQGKTSRTAAVVLNDATRYEFFRVGIQSKTFEDAETAVFAEAIVNAYPNIPRFFQPTIKEVGGQIFSKKGMFWMKKPKNKRDKDRGLQSTINYRSSKEKAYDGYRMNRYIGDEEGKCLSFNTPVLLHDGSIKVAQDVAKGDVLMGDDSTGRQVLSTTTGKEEMYDVVPTKGETWGCNKSHILSLRWCSSRPDFGWKKDQIINITVAEYLTLSPRTQKHLVLWKTGVEYKEQPHVIPPYLMGLWLGDGHSISPTIFGIDTEIFDYVKGFADASKIAYSYFSDRRTRCAQFSLLGDENRINPIARELRRLGILGSGLKAIPNVYKIDSRSNRLEVLAGLIDSDGSRPYGTETKRVYEITQKNEKLARSICIVANSVGFHSSVYERTATMKRADGSRYSCRVWRVRIYGDLHDIPCKVERKKYSPPCILHINRRNPLRIGFKLVPKGVGDYYGFTITGNRLFVLGDYTVTHNTEDADVYARWGVVKECLVDKDKNIIGKSWHTSTVEDMDEGGKEFKELWKESNQYEGMPTPSGLYRLFMPADRCRNADKYGKVDREKNLAEIMEARKLQEGKRGAASAIRKEALNELEMFMVDETTCIYENPVAISARLSMLELMKKPRYMTGNFEWVDGIEYGDVEFIECPDGRFRVLELPPEEHRNNVRGRSGRWRPGNKGAYFSGVDPVDHAKVTVEHERRMSMPSITIVKGESVNMGPLFQNVPVVMYNVRPALHVFYNDLKKVLWIYGCDTLIENQKDGVIQEFDECGMAEFMVWLPGRNAPGVAATTANTYSMARLMDTMLEDHLNDIWFPTYLSECTVFDPDDTTKYDESMSCGYAKQHQSLLGTRKKDRKKAAAKGKKRLSARDTVRCMTGGR